MAADEVDKILSQIRTIDELSPELVYQLVLRVMSELMTRDESTARAGFYRLFTNLDESKHEELFQNFRALVLNSDIDPATGEESEAFRMLQDLFVRNATPSD